MSAVKGSQFYLLSHIYFSYHSWLPRKCSRFSEKQDPQQDQHSLLFTGSRGEKCVVCCFFSFCIWKVDLFVRCFKDGSSIWLRMFPFPEILLETTSEVNFEALKLLSFKINIPPSLPSFVVIPDAYFLFWKLSWESAWEGRWCSEPRTASQASERMVAS